MRNLVKRFVLFAVVTVLCLGGLLSGCKSKPLFEVPDSAAVTDVAATNTVIPEFGENKQFRIFADCPPTATVRSFLEDYKAAGFTHLNMTEDNEIYLTNADQSYGTADDGVINPKYIEALDLAHEVGLKVVIRNFYADADYFVNDDDSVRYFEPPWNTPYNIPVRNITNELTNHPAVDGYYMGDEPSDDKIDKLVPLTDWYNSYGASTNWFHINLLQTYGSDYFKPYSYEEYVKLYVDKILSKVNGHKTLGTDYYPLKADRVGNPYIMEGILFDYIVIAEQVKTSNAVFSAENKILTNFCIQAYNASNTRTLSSLADITFQTNLALAFGAKSIQYYRYESEGGEGAIVENSSHKPTPMYYWVKDANAELDVIADAILNFDWVGTKVYQGRHFTDTEHTALGFENIKSKTLESFSMISDAICRLDTVISEMKDANGNLGYMVVNYTEPSIPREDQVMLYFSKKVNKAVIYSAGERKVVDVKNNRMMLELPAGGGAFVYPVYEGGAN